MEETRWTPPECGNDERNEYQDSRGSYGKRRNYGYRRRNSEYHGHGRAWTPNGIMVRVELQRDLFQAIGEISKGKGYTSIYQAIREACEEYADKYSLQPEEMPEDQD